MRAYHEAARPGDGKKSPASGPGSISWGETVRSFAPKLNVILPQCGHCACELVHIMHKSAGWEADATSAVRLVGRRFYFDIERLAAFDRQGSELLHLKNKVAKRGCGIGEIDKPSSEVPVVHERRS